MNNLNNINNKIIIISSPSGAGKTTICKSLLKKIDQWSGVPAAWEDHRGYINSWCKRTGTPLFKSQSNFADHITAWKEATIGKRKKKKVPYFFDTEKYSNLHEEKST